MICLGLALWGRRQREQSLRHHDRLRQTPDPSSPRPRPCRDQQAVGSESHKPPPPGPRSRAFERDDGEARRRPRPRTCHGSCGCGTNSVPQPVRCRPGLAWSGGLDTHKHPRTHTRPILIPSPHLFPKTVAVIFHVQLKDCPELFPAATASFLHLVSTTNGLKPRGLNIYKSLNNGSRTRSSGLRKVCGH